MAMKAMAATKTMKDAKAMKAAKCSNAMKAAKCSKAMKAAECSKAMNALKATKCSNAAECSKDAKEISKEEYQRVKAEILAMKPMKTMTEAAPPKMKPTESSRAREDEARKCSRTLGNLLKSLLEHPKFCGYESVEKDCYAIKDLTDHVETLGATIKDATTEWEVIPLQVFFKNGQPREVEVLWLEKEQCRCLPRRTLLVL